MKIGKYELTTPYLSNDDVWIRKECGEGGQFNKHELFEKLEKVIEEFYKENF